MRWLEILLSSSIVIWLLIICFIMVVVITIDKLKKVQSTRTNIPSFSIKIRALVKKKEIENALGLCMEDKSPIANIIRRGLKKQKYGRARIIEEVEAAGQFEIKKLENGLSTLATISAAAPMLGFLGTILGMGSIFRVIQNTQGEATFGDFSRSILYALVASGLGLLIGIIALAVYNYLVTRIAKVVMSLERVVTEIFDALEEGEKEIIPVEESEE
jgi:biopolymer transport protein ExbB